MAVSRTPCKNNLVNFEEDEAIVDLADGGDINGHTLDDIDRMTRNELRAALR